MYTFNRDHLSRDSVSCGAADLREVVAEKPVQLLLVQVLHNNKHDYDSLSLYIYIKSLLYITIIIIIIKS